MGPGPVARRPDGKGQAGVAVPSDGAEGHSRHGQGRDRDDPPASCDVRPLSGRGQAGARTPSSRGGGRGREHQGRQVLPRACAEPAGFQYRLLRRSDRRGIGLSTRLFSLAWRAQPPGAAPHRRDSARRGGPERTRPGEDAEGTGVSAFAKGRRHPFQAARRSPAGHQPDRARKKEGDIGLHAADWRDPDLGEPDHPRTAEIGPRRAAEDPQPAAG